jgi:hypothetical protein
MASEVIMKKYICTPKLQYGTVSGQRRDEPEVHVMNPEPVTFAEIANEWNNALEIAAAKMWGDHPATFLADDRSTLR